MEPLLVSEPDDGVAVLTFNRPEKRNALSAVLREQLLAAFDRFAAHPDVRVLVITGAGAVFCAGFDLEEMKAAGGSAEERAARMEASDRFHHGILRFPLPVVASVNGPALAGGFDVAVLADLRIAADTARFAHMEYSWGPVIYRPLRDLVGGSAARDLVLTGRTVDAGEALRIGLVNRVVPAAALADATRALATTIARAPREVLLHMKAKILDASGIGRDLTTLDL